MAARQATWKRAVKDICEQLEWFAVWRDTGLSVAETARQMRISLATAKRYEATLQVLLAALKEAAAPAATDAADDAEERTTTS